MYGILTVINNNTFCLIFQVKACAIQRIRDGETKVQVARDLQCPVSTVSSWWHRRASIVPELASEVNSDSAVSSVSQIDFIVKADTYISNLFCKYTLPGSSIILHGFDPVSKTPGGLLPHFFCYKMKIKW